MTEPSDDLDVDVVKLARMHDVLERVLAEIRTIDLDPAALERVEAVTQRALVEIGGAVSGDLLHELASVVGGQPGSAVTADELRVIEAQLLGWLHGIAGGEGLAPRRDAGVDAPSPVVGRGRPVSSPGYR